ICLSIILIIVIFVCLYLYHDLKKEKKMKFHLRNLKQKAEESEKMKTAFINSICHEIRTPLNSIVGFSDLIFNDEIDKETREGFSQEIQKSTILLTSLIDNMLEIS
ncbi:sensor histidine kinase, partial [Bacteroides fragilis]